MGVDWYVTGSFMVTPNTGVLGRDENPSVESHIRSDSLPALTVVYI